MPPSIQIETLLARVAEGDERAFAELYDATSRYVFGILRRMLPGADVAEDVAQEVYLQIWRRAGSFDAGRGSAWSWVALLTRSRGVDRLRADGSYRAAVEDLESRPQAAPLGQPADDPSRHAGRVERGRAVRGVMSELPEEQRSALEMAFFGGLSHREIAESTGTPLGTIKTRIRTAILTLRDRLEPGVEG